MTRDDHLADAAEYDAIAAACLDAAREDDLAAVARTARLSYVRLSCHAGTWTATVTRADDPHHPCDGSARDPVLAIRDALRVAGCYYLERARTCREWAEEESDDQTV